MSELKPCPFCGRDPIIIKVSRYSRKHLIKCTGCKVAPEVTGFEKLVAINIWNSRADSERIKELEDALLDVIDGYPAHDLTDRTGLSLERCEEIWMIATKGRGNN